MSDLQTPQPETTEPPQRRRDRTSDRDLESNMNPEQRTGDDGRGGEKRQHKESHKSRSRRDLRDKSDQHPSRSHRKHRSESQIYVETAPERGDAGSRTEHRSRQNVDRKVDGTFSPDSHPSKEQIKSTTPSNPLTSSLPKLKLKDPVDRPATPQKAKSRSRTAAQPSKREQEGSRILSRSRSKGKSLGNLEDDTSDREGRKDGGGSGNGLRDRPLHDPVLERESKSIVADLLLMNESEADTLSPITTLTSRLFKSDSCALTLIDDDRVHWVSVYGGDANIGRRHSEPRSTSMASWVFEHRKGDAVVVLNSWTDIRCSGVKGSTPKFFAGAPLILSSGHRLGALTLTGPPRTDFRKTELKLLHAMADFAAHKLSLLLSQRDFFAQQELQQARTKLAQLERQSGDGGETIVQRAVEVVREGME
ncbi:hypothetical protein HK104_002396, partial [Borealophlyctis nickersoniae]